MLRQITRFYAHFGVPYHLQFCVAEQHKPRLQIIVGVCYLVYAEYASYFGRLANIFTLSNVYVYLPSSMPWIISQTLSLYGVGTPYFLP